MTDSNGGLSKYGSLLMSVLVAVVTAGIMWGVYASRTDSADDRINALSARLTAHDIQINANATVIATLTERMAAETRQSVATNEELNARTMLRNQQYADTAARLKAVEEDRLRSTAVMADMLARLKAIEDLLRRR